MFRVAVVGLGRRSQRYAIPYILQNNTHWQLEAVCDPSSLMIEKYKVAFPQISHVSSFEDISSMISSKPIDCAYVAVPHYQGPTIVKQLLSSKIHVIKEKPAAITAIELKAFQELARLNGVTFSTASQFRYSEQVQRMQEWLHLIGKIRFVEGISKVSVTDLGAGWRASRVLSGGGALIDLGWHLVDIVMKLLSDQITPDVQFAQFLQGRPSQEYDCEDTTRAVLNIHNSKLAAKNGTISCSLFITRLGPKKTSQLTIYGDHGSLRLEDDSVQLNIRDRSERADFSTSISPFQRMMKIFHARIAEPSRNDEDQPHAYQDMITTQTIDSIYAAGKAVGDAIVCDNDLQNLIAHSTPDCKYRWPPVDETTKKAVEEQLHNSVSIYDDSGIFGEFEKAWQKRHMSPESFALLHNSGTNALQALYFAAQFQPGDEIIFPVYTFHATCSPAIQFGVIPVFCDASEDGNISPEAISAAITSRTKAVVVTHLWGMPCNMKAICNILKKYPDVLLLEDCSHAHGATIDGKVVGTFGDAAAWSLQGQKIISGGEGGITLTRNSELYYRQLLWGHYNKRCKAEIPRDHHLSSFALTGAGAKNRAHPLAVALAFTQLQRLDNILRFKALYASQMISRLASIPFLKTPNIVTLGGTQIQPAWYALVLRFIPSQAPRGLDRESFVGALHARGLCEVDIPKSTGLLHQEALYTVPEKLFPHLYPDGIPHATRTNVSFSRAQAFYDEAIKLPVWTSRKDQAVVDHYLDVICDVARAKMFE